MKPATPTERTSCTASAVILGADALLAARPATPVQLVHGCLQAGYLTVAPPSLGDELLAAEAMRQTAQRGERPLVYCACPHVSARLLDVGNDLAPFLISLVAPPVAAARYLRALAGSAPIRIAFVGACPSGADESIDERFTPSEFLSMLSEQGIELFRQAEIFDSVLPPDRRRHRSLPGGVPAPDVLWSEGNRRSLIELAEEDPLTELAQHLAQGERALLDPGVVLGCSCAGAWPGTPARNARSAVAALEPPRTTSELVEPNVFVQLTRSLPAAARPEGRSLSPVSVPAHAADDVQEPEESEPLAPVDEKTAVAAPVRPGGGEHAATVLAPEAVGPSTGAFHPGAATAEGRRLPRAYMARRRATLRSRNAAERADHEQVRSPVDTGSTEGRGQPAVSAPAAIDIQADEDSEGEQAPSILVEASGIASGQPAIRSLTNGSPHGRLFAAVPVAATSAIQRQVLEPQPEPEAVVVAMHPASVASGTSTPEAAAVPTGSSLNGAQRRKRQPVPFVILLALVAALSVAVGLAAGRALDRLPAAASREVSPSPSPPAQIPPSAPESRVAADPSPSAAAVPERTETDATSERTAGSPQAPEQAPSPARETASGVVAPVVESVDSAVVRNDTLGGRLTAPGPSASGATDSLADRERMLLLAEIADRRRRIDSLQRLDSLRIDSLRRVIDSTRSPPPSR
ncbi:MAG TPA: hypothetical protein VMM18_06650 [Gemmatimonadaceae bacterium]|nr:hypothetical protein [Gemmatimonadaceae bacterium]